MADDTKDRIAGENALISQLKKELAKKDTRISELEHTVRAITQTRGWRLLERLRRVKGKIAPPETRRHKIINLTLRSFKYIRREGIYSFIKNAGLRYDISASFFADEDYKKWVKQNEPGNDDLLAQRKLSRKFGLKPKISIVTPVFNPDRKVFTAMLDSVLNQTYENWELCLADASSKPHVKEIIADFMKSNRGKIRVKYLEKNLGISGNSNEALSLATGDYIALLDHDDTLAPFALFEMAKVINQQCDTDIIYSDRDIISRDDQRMYPFFKPDWSPDYLLSQNYLCHLIVFRAELLTRIHGFREGFDGSQDYDLFLRATEAAHKIVHIPKVLYHWRIVPGSSSVDPTAKPYAYDAAIKALQEALVRRGLNGTVTHGETKGFYDLRFAVEGEPKVLIVLISNGRKDKLKTAIDSILNKSTYRNYEIVVAGCENPYQVIPDRHKDGVGLPAVKSLACDDKRNISGMINAAVSQTDAEYVALLNEAAEVITPDWLEYMLGFAQRRETGAVGAKLLSSDGRVYSAGLILDKEGKVRRSHHGIPGNSPGYNGRAISVNNVSAVSGCMMIRKEVFAGVKGLDPQFTFNSDIDLCLKLLAKSYLIVFAPHAEFYIHECGEEHSGTQETAEKERRLLSEKWRDMLKRGDPFYSPNLTPDKNDFSDRV